MIVKLNQPPDLHIHNLTALCMSHRTRFVDICCNHYSNSQSSFMVHNYSQFEEASRVTSVEILNGYYDQKRKRLNGAVVNNLINY